MTTNETITTIPLPLDKWRELMTVELLETPGLEKGARVLAYEYNVYTLAALLLHTWEEINHTRHIGQKSQAYLARLLNDHKVRLPEGKELETSAGTFWVELGPIGQRVRVAPAVLKEMPILHVLHYNSQLRWFALHTLGEILGVETIDQLSSVSIEEHRDRAMALYAAERRSSPEQVRKKVQDFILGLNAVILELELHKFGLLPPSRRP